MSLPDDSKLQSLYQAGKKDSSLGLPIEAGLWFWSSSEVHATLGSSVDFGYGNTNYFRKGDEFPKVLCVGD